ncbi:MAG: DsrE family protein [Candidatus Bathyarchaeia archaeon]
MTEEKTKTILYVQTSGVDAPERLYSPFVLAATAKAMGLDAVIYFLGMGVTVVKQGEAEKVKLGAFPTLKEVMEEAVKVGVRLEVCEQSCMLLGLERGHFVPEAKIVGAATLNARVLEADGVMWF